MSSGDLFGLGLGRPEEGGSTHDRGVAHLVRVRASGKVRLRVSVRVRVRVRVRVWPTVKWNFLSVLQAALKNRIWRTLTTAVEMK